MPMPGQPAAKRLPGNQVALQRQDPQRNGQRRQKAAQQEEGPKAKTQQWRDAHGLTFIENLHTHSAYVRPGPKAEALPTRST